MRDVRFVVTCEHGGNRVPARYRALFVGADRVLASHRGWDPGALTLARQLARTLAAPLIVNTTTRLLIDFNRSEHHHTLFSEFTNVLTSAAQQRLIETYHRPYRSLVRAAIDTQLRRGARVVHISAHSFVPVLDGEVRRADVGLLYDPRRKREADACRALANQLPQLKVRRNYPYRGDADGLTTALRGEYRAADYVGIEIELNQNRLTKPVMTTICGAVQSLGK